MWSKSRIEETTPSLVLWANQFLQIAIIVDIASSCQRAHAMKPLAHESSSLGEVTLPAALLSLRGVAVTVNVQMGVEHNLPGRFAAKFHEVVGDVVGDVVGRDTVGVAVGLLVGFDTVGLAVGDADGAPVGAAVGTGRKQHDRLQRLATSGSAHALEPRWELKWWIVNWQAS